MKKFYRGEIIPITAGAIQFVRNNEKKRDFILFTSRNGDVYIPVSAIEKALHDQWNADQELRNHRINKASHQDMCERHGHEDPCERCV